MQNLTQKFKIFTRAILVINCFVFFGMVTSTHAGNATLTWQANPESDLAGYRVYQQILPSGIFQQIYSGMPPVPNSPEYTVTGLQFGNTYNYHVTAFDLSGNEGPPSNEVSKTIDSTSILINFQPSSATVPAGYAKDTGSLYTASRGYGWNIVLGNRDRNSVSDQRLDTFVFNKDATWQYDLPNGDYLVSLASGDASYAQGPHEVVVEGTTVINNIPTTVGEFLEVTNVPISVSDGQLTIDLSPTGYGLTMLNYVIIATPGSGGGTPPTIQFQPGDQTVTAGETATFAVTATGDPTLLYQWQELIGSTWTNIPGATHASYTTPATEAADDGTQFRVRVTNAGGEALSASATLTVESGGNPSVEAWQASFQNSGSWKNSSWANRSFRILLEGNAITRSGSNIRLVLRGRTSSSYTVENLSLVRRQGNTLNGVSGTYAEVLFGGNGVVTVPAGSTVTSDPIEFDLQIGQDVFLTYWVPSGQPTVYRSGGTSTSTWTISGSDQSATINWEGLNFSETRSYIYIAESMRVTPTGEANTTIKVNFQTNGATVPSGYLKDAGAVYSSARGYGWDTSLGSRDRNSVTDQRLDTFVFSKDARWQFNLPNGNYLVSLASGDADYTQGPHEVVVEGTTVIDNLPASAGEFLTVTDVPITVSDGQLTIDLSPTGAGLTMLNYVIITTSASE